MHLHHVYIPFIIFFHLFFLFLFGSVYAHFFYLFIVNDHSHLQQKIHKQLNVIELCLMFALLRTTGILAFICLHNKRRHWPTHLHKDIDRSTYTKSLMDLLRYLLWNYLISHPLTIIHSCETNAFHLFVHALIHIGTVNREENCLWLKHINKKKSKNQISWTTPVVHFRSEVNYESERSLCLNFLCWVEKYKGFQRFLLTCLVTFTA